MPPTADTYDEFAAVSGTATEQPSAETRKQIEVNLAAQPETVRTSAADKEKSRGSGATATEPGVSSANAAAHTTTAVAATELDLTADNSEELWLDVFLFCSDALIDASQLQQQSVDIEFALELTIPFLANRTLALSMCHQTRLGRTAVGIYGEHLHTWCQPCANNQCEYFCLVVHEACSVCIALRTLSLLSVRWHTFCWEQLPYQSIFFWEP